MTNGDHVPHEPGDPKDAEGQDGAELQKFLINQEGSEETPRVYELIYDTSDRARALAPGIAASLRAVVILLRIPAIFFAISAALPILGTALIAGRASGFAQFVLFAITGIALAIEVLFIWRTRAYGSAIRQERFVDEVAELIDIADMSDELLDRIRAATGRGLGFQRLRKLWELWRTPNYFTERIGALKLVRNFVPPRINLNIRLAVAQFWSTLIMWFVLVVALIARLTGAI